MRIIIQSTPVNYSLVNLTAVDADEGINQEVSFSLEDSFLPFQISGQELTVSGTLEAKTYKVVVEVTDHGTPALSSNTTVTVQVEPNNEYFPEFQLTPYEFEFLENSNGSVFTFNITDGDTGGLGTPGTANITLLPSTYSSSFELSMEHTSWGTVGRLTVLSPFDHETLTTLNLTVQAYDTGYVEFRKTSETTIIVVIGDVNDNFPHFTNDTYIANVAENATNGHLFFQVAANDEDTDLDSSLTFSLLNHKDTFAINPSTGWIYVIGTLNRASFPNYTLELQVNDTSDHTDTAYVFVTVIEVNEHTPYFDPIPPNTITVDEDDFYSLNISVFDSDLGPAGVVMLTLMQSYGMYFEIQDNSELVLIEDLDYEVRYEGESMRKCTCSVRGSEEVVSGEGGSDSRI